MSGQFVVKHKRALLRLCACVLIAAAGAQDSTSFREGSTRQATGRPTPTPRKRLHGLGRSHSMQLCQMTWLGYACNLETMQTTQICGCKDYDETLEIQVHSTRRRR
eukprot:6205970-Pleurochrysis_carterae.AAC.5